MGTFPPLTVLIGGYCITLEVPPAKDPSAQPRHQHKEAQAQTQKSLAFSPCPP